MDPGTPRGSWIPVASLKERCPDPLDDRGHQSILYNMKVIGKLSIVWPEFLVSSSFFSINLPIDKMESLQKLLIATKTTLKQFPESLFVIHRPSSDKKDFMDSNYTKCFMLYNFNHFNSEWGLSFSDRSYPEKTKKKINGLVGQKIDPYVTIGSWRV